MYPSTITKEEAIKKILNLNSLDRELADYESVDLSIAEYLRRTLCNLVCAYDSGENFQPVYITRLTNSVRRQLYPIWPDLNRSKEQRQFAHEHEPESDINSDSVKRILRILNDTRDFMEVENGYWLPTPVRLIQLPEKDKVLVVGGVATLDLFSILNAEVKVSGFARYVERSLLPETIINDNTWWQPYEDWLGDVPKSLKDWTENILAESRQRLCASAADFTDFEVYFPSVQVSQQQYYRWIRFEELVRKLDNLPSELVLCRSLSMPRSYWLGSITLTGLKSEAHILPRIVRRLMYGLDSKYGAPTQAAWEAGDVIIFKSWLPPEERRLLLALGYDVSVVPGKLPIRYRIEPAWYDLLTNILKNLGMQVIDNEENVK